MLRTIVALLLACWRMLRSRRRTIFWSLLIGILRQDVTKILSLPIVYGLATWTVIGALLIR